MRDVEAQSEEFTFSVIARDNGSPQLLAKNSTKVTLQCPIENTSPIAKDFSGEVEPSEEITIDFATLISDSDNVKVKITSEPVCGFLDSVWQQGILVDKSSAIYRAKTVPSIELGLCLITLIRKGTLLNFAGETLILFAIICFSVILLNIGNFFYNSYSFVPSGNSQPPIIRDQHDPSPKAVDIMREVRDIVTNVSGDVYPYIVWTPPNNIVTLKKASIFVEAKVPIVGTVNYSSPSYNNAYPVWKGCDKWVSAPFPNSHWERLGTNDFVLKLGSWDRRLSSSADVSTYTAAIEGLFPIGNTTISCNFESDQFKRPEVYGDPAVVYKHLASLADTTFSILVIADHTPPSIITPTSLVRNPNSADGSVIEYTVNATDNSGGRISVMCNPSSGSLFPVGKSSVTCQANDKFGNHGEKIFPVTVLAQNGLPGQAANNEQKCVKIRVVNISASGFETDPADYHPASSAIDGDSSTWWSNKDNSQLKIDLGKPNHICGIEFLWNKGDVRKYNFEITASENGNGFKKVFEGKNGGSSSSGVEAYKFDEFDGQYLNLDVTSDSKRGWVSIREINVLGYPTN